MDAFSLRYPQEFGEIPQDCSLLHATLGADVSRKDNLHLVDENVFAYTVGNVTVFVDMVMRSFTYVQGLDTGGVGCMCLHPQKNKFSVGGRGYLPRILIYSYPDMLIHKKLLGGADKGYSNVSFNSSGDRLVSVSSAPDFMLTVWDWDNEVIILHAKAFGQDVFSAKFSAGLEGRLTTSGTGHIRFWKMASTFTGQKLQGLIGKFGKVELSDIGAFVEFPDGKVLSGTETGAMLLWDGNFIKSRLVRDKGLLCHRGEITYLAIDRVDDVVISSGLDGCILLWDLKTIDAAESFADNSVDVIIEPLAEYCIGPGIGIKSLVDSGRTGDDRFFIIHDTKGRFLRLNFLYSPSMPSLRMIIAAVTAEDNYTYALSVLTDYHAGAVTGLDASPMGHIAATCGADGVVKCWDYTNREVIDSFTNACAATALRWAPLWADPTGKTFITGFADGVIRRFLIERSTDTNMIAIALVKAYKPHNAAVTDIRFSAQHNLLFTLGNDGIIFVFKCEKFIDSSTDNWIPQLFVTIAPGTNIYGMKMSVHHSLRKVLVSCSDGVTREIDFENIGSQQEEESPVDGEAMQSYEQFFPIKSLIIEIKESGKKMEDDATAAPIESEDIPETDSALPEVLVSSASLIPRLVATIYAMDDTDSTEVIIATDEDCSIVMQYSLGISKLQRELKFGNYSSDGKNASRAPVVTTLQYSLNNKYLLMGMSDGSLSVRESGALESYLKLQAHGGSSSGSVTSVVTSYDDSYVLSAGSDGTLAVFRLNAIGLSESSAAITKESQSNLSGKECVKQFATKHIAPPFLHIVESIKSATSIYENFGFQALVKRTDISFLEEAAAAPKLPRNSIDVEDGAYSIQDAKLKSEQDAKRKIAEEMKHGIREVIKLLREDYQHILKQNEKIPPEVRLTEKELEVDTAYFQYLKEKGRKAVQEIHLESEYDLEKSITLSSKLKSRMMDNILMEEMPLSCLDPSKTRVVYSLRVRGIDDRVQKILDAIGQQVKQDQLDESRRWAANAAQKKAAKTLEEMQKRAITKKDSLNHGEDHDAQQQHMTSAAVRREFRKARKATIDKHNAEKPNKDDDDIQDLEAIRVAQETLGDYKLKCADEYEVPEDQRINAQQKKRQLALLEESTVTMRLRFNQRFLSMRQLKRQMIINICKDNARIREINRELNDEELSRDLWDPEYDLREYPDDRYEVTQEELEEYASSRKYSNWKDTIAPMNKTSTGSKTFIYCDISTGVWSVSAAPTEKNVHADTEEGENTIFAANNTVLSAFISDRGSAEAKRIAYLESKVPCLILAKAALKSITQLETSDEALQRLRDDRRRSLQYERKMLMAKTATDITSFDDALDDLRLDRHNIISDLKLAELKLLVLFQEYELLLTFEGKDFALQQKLLNCQKDKDDNIFNYNECQVKLSLKNDDLKQWNDKIQRIIEEYRELISDINPSAETLSKIFKKKIKRVKATDGDESEEEYDDEDEDYDEEEEDVEDHCPPGCELHFYESVLELRSRRLDAEDSVAEVQKKIDDFRKSLDRLKQREKQIDKDLKQTCAEIQQFQQQKQAALNKIDVVVPLSISQLYAFESSGQLSGPRDFDMAKLAKDDGVDETSSVGSFEDMKTTVNMVENRTLVTAMTMQSHVVIKKSVLERLKRRVKELISECKAARGSYRALHKDRSRLEKTKEIETQKIEILNAKADNLQLHKFGRIVDLDTLDADGEQGEENSAEVTARIARERNATMIDNLEKESEELKDKLAEVTKTNTELLTKIATLLTERAKIATDLKAPGSDVLQDNSALIRDEEFEKRKLVDIVAKQAQEIQSIKLEVTNLKRKDIPNSVPSLPPPHASAPGFLPPILQSKRSV